MIRINGKDLPSTINDPSTPGTPIGTYHLADNAHIFEIQRRNNFELIVTDIDGIIKPGMSTYSYDNASELIRLSVISCDIPSFEQDVIPVRRGNTTLNYAGVPSFNTGSVTVNDYIGADIVGILTAWQALSYNVYTEKVGVAAEYKKDCTLLQYSPDYQLVRAWKLHGCWINSLSFGTMSSEDGGKSEVSMSLTYDRAEIDVTGLED